MTISKDHLEVLRCVSVLTQEGFKERLLGTNKNLSVPGHATFLVTGNNLTFVGDISTRAILCCLDPSCERPEEREFDVNLYNYIPIHRPELVKEALTILRAYHVADRPNRKSRRLVVLRNGATLSVLQ